ncbi:MAG: hypothetical protein R6V49_09355 [Bacteroidales bacterium]
MNTDHQIDKTFREGLEGSRMDPPPHLWGKISESTAKGAPLNGQQRRRGMFFLISGTGLLVLTGIILFLTLPSGRKMQEQHTVEPPAPVVSAQNIENTPQPVQTFHPQPGNLTHQSNTIPEGNVPGALVTAESSEEKTKKAPGEITAQDVIGATLPEERIPQIAVEKTVGQISADAEIGITVGSFEATDVMEDTTPEEQIAPETEEDRKIPEPPISNIRKREVNIDIARGWSSGIALHAGPLLFQPVYPPDQKIGAGLDGLAYGHLQYRRLSVGAGLGLTRFREKGPWELEILQLDTTGTYQYVTGVNFQPVYNPVDSTITGYTAVNISTVNHPIVDSSLTVITRDAINRYTFLQVPLFVGYDFLRTENSTITAMGGVIRNVMIAEQKPVPEYGDEKLLYARHDLGLLRKEEYWQYHLGIRVRYDLNHVWYAEGMASYRKAFNTLYEGSAATGKTSMVLISAGIGFWF